jgi:hydrogenase nickel incorporation protein HypA/HybF
MHEFGLCDGIIEAVQQRAAGRQVARVCVQVGVLHRVSLEAFRHDFAHGVEGTEAENAVLDLVLMPVRVVCRTCQAETEGDDIILACPQCKGIDIDLIGGDELVLESVEYEGPAATSWLGKE